MINLNHSCRFYSKYAYLLLFVLSLLMYSNSIQNDYGFDDQLITENFKQDKSVKDFFTTYTFENNAKNIAFGFRPFVLLTFSVENYFFGNNPHISHFINVLLYALISVLIYYLLLHLFPNYNKFIIFLSVFIFIIHPLHTEPVNNIKSRDELLIAFFGILSLILYLKYLKSKKILPLLLIILISISGVLSKKNYVIYLALIPLLSVVFSQKIVLKEMIVSFILILIPLMTLSLLKTTFVNHTAFIRVYEYFENPLYFNNFFFRIPAGFTVLLYNLLLIFFPFKLSFYYGYDVIPIHTWTNTLPYVSILFFCFVVFLLFKTLKTKPFLSFGIGVLLTNLFMVSNIIIPVPGIIGERFLFIGTLGYSILFACFLYNLLSKISWIKVDKIKMIVKPIVVFFVLILLTPFIYKTYSRNFDWKNTNTLLKKDISHLKQSSKANELIASIYLSKFKNTKRKIFLSKAKNHYEQCINIYAKYPAAWNNLGYIYLVTNDWNNAEIAYRNALKYDKTNPNPPFNLAILYQKQGKIQQAKYYYLKAIDINPSLQNLLPYFKSFIIKENLVNNIIPAINKRILTKDNYNLRMLLIDLYFLNNNYNKLTILLNETYNKYPTEEIKKYMKQFKQYKGNFY